MHRAQNHLFPVHWCALIPRASSRRTTSLRRAGARRRAKKRARQQNDRNFYRDIFVLIVTAGDNFLARRRCLKQRMGRACQAAIAGTRGLAGMCFQPMFTGCL
jgi:hypothetical protein